MARKNTKNIVKNKKNVIPSGDDIVSKRLENRATVIFYFVFALFCCFLVWVFVQKMVVNNKDYNINKIHVVDNHLLSNEKILDVLMNKDIPGEKINSFIDKNYFSIPIKQIRQVLESQPLIARASVSRVFPNELKIKIKERRIVAMLQNGLLVDDENNICPRNIVNTENLVKIIWGKNALIDNIKEGDKLPYEFAEILKLKRYIEISNVYELSILDIESIYYDVSGSKPKAKLILREKFPFKSKAQLFLPLHNVEYSYEEALKKVAIIIKDRINAEKNIGKIDASLTNYIPITPK